MPDVRYPDSEEPMAEAPLPRDCADFKRCVLLLVEVPQVKDLFEQIAAKGGPGWKRLLDRWGEAGQTPTPEGVGLLIDKRTHLLRQV